LSNTHTHTHTLTGISIDVLLCIDVSHFFICLHHPLSFSPCSSISKPIKWTLKNLNCFFPHTSHTEITHWYHTCHTHSPPPHSVCRPLLLQRERRQTYTKLIPPPLPSKKVRVQMEYLLLVFRRQLSDHTHTYKQARCIANSIQNNILNTQKKKKKKKKQTK
jgi:hypothetical protein